MAQDPGLIELVKYLKKDNHPYVVFALLGEDGVAVRGESKEACEVMVKILGDPYRMMPRVDLLQDCEQVLAEQALEGEVPR